MRTLSVLVIVATSSLAIASPLETGIYGGGFISNYYHQFYDDDLFPGVGQPTSREELQRLSPMGGARFAYFMTPWLGLEAELNLIMTETKVSRGSAQIWGARGQLIFQLPGRSVVPYVAIGDGFDHVASASSVLGSDTDWPIHAGAGLRFLLTPSITIRVDGRFLRAPSQQPPRTLNASLGEFMFGISYRTGGASPPPVEVLPPPPPPRDSDGDGITDDVDRCPNEAEDKDRFDDRDGCPDPDNDADGILDAQDQCPNEAEDKDGFKDDDGCPDPDNDADGILDAQDKCPNEAEDKDGFKDDDGCPDPDNDSDGFLDPQDKCPNEAEVINGVEDDDGCPDRGNSLVVVSPDRLELLESIDFKKATISGSDNVLGQLGATLRAHSEIARLRIAVHVQPSKKPDADLALSEQRANAIRDWLVHHGIDGQRLESRGFGSTKPLVPTSQKGSKAINERIELIILERK